MLGTLSTAVVRARASSSPSTSTARGGGITTAGGRGGLGAPPCHLTCSRSRSVCLCLAVLCKRVEIDIAVGGRGWQRKIDVAV